MRRLGTVALILLFAGALLHWLKYSTPGYAELTRPIDSVDLQAEAVEARSFSARIIAARLSSKLAFSQYGKRVSFVTRSMPPGAFSSCSRWCAQAYAACLRLNVLFSRCTMRPLLLMTICAM